MKVHIRQRCRLDNHMQHFIGNHAQDFHARIYRESGSKAYARWMGYGDVVMRALERRLLEHPKKHGINSMLLSLVDRNKLREIPKSPQAEALFEGLLNDDVVFLSDEYAK